jgi:hypothetical protein
VEILRLRGELVVNVCFTHPLVNPLYLPTPPTSQNWEKENLGLRPLEYSKILHVAFK